MTFIGKLMYQLSSRRAIQSGEKLVSSLPPMNWPKPSEATILR
jgi:hypothetical protein